MSASLVVAAAAARGFAPIDWLVLALYLAAVVALGVVAGRRGKGRDDFFLAGRAMPVWAVATSVLATALSAATFIGGPQQAYAGDLTYFAANAGALVGVVIVAVFFLPAYYRHGVTSVYELLGHTYGASARTAASGMFMVGRVFASARARLFMVALPFALVAFGDTRPSSLVVSIAIIAAAAAAYTAVGGIRAVIWTDVLQAVLVIGTVAVALGLLWSTIPLGPGELIAALRASGDGDKLRLVDWSLDPSRPYTVAAILVGFTLFNIAAFGTDQDLTQRMLTCRNARAGAWSVVIANLLSWPVVLLFLLIGLLLFVRYERPDLAGGAPVLAIMDDRRVFLDFMLAEMPAGLRGLMIAGLFAAAMSSLDSALNAMASTTVADFYRPWLRRSSRVASGEADEIRRERRVARVAVVAWAAALAGFAIGCVYWQTRSGQTLIDFALGVMVFAYGGLLGVFLTALFTRRGSAASAVAALATGFAAVVLMQDFAWRHWAPRVGLDVTLAFPWKMVAATAASFLVCCLGRRPSTPPAAPLSRDHPPAAPPAAPR